MHNNRMFEKFYIHTTDIRGASSNPSTVRGRSIFTPGASIGTRIMLCCRCFAADGSVLPMKMHSWQRGSHAPGKQFSHTWTIEKIHFEVQWPDTIHTINSKLNLCFHHYEINNIVFITASKLAWSIAMSHHCFIQSYNYLSFHKHYSKSTQVFNHKLLCPPDVHHLWPFMTYSLPSRTIDAVMLVASDEATWWGKGVTNKHYVYVFMIFIYIFFVSLFLMEILNGRLATCQWVCNEVYQRWLIKKYWWFNTWYLWNNMK